MLRGGIHYQYQQQLQVGAMIRASV